MTDWRLDKLIHRQNPSIQVNALTRAEKIAIIAKEAGHKQREAKKWTLVN